MSLPGRIDGLEESAGTEVNYIVGIFQGYTGDSPVPADAVSYWESIDEPSFPVLSDPAVDLLANTPYDGQGLPGKCVLAPDMEILGCQNGHGEDYWATVLIAAHLGG